VLSHFQLFNPLPGRGEYPVAITRGPDGNLWFTTSNDRIGRITPSGQMTEFTPPYDPSSITAGPDGNVWFTSPAGEIVRVTPDGQFSSFPLPDSRAQPSEITAGPDGNLWFTDAHGDRIGEFVLQDAPPAPPGAPSGSSSPAAPLPASGGQKKPTAATDLAFALLAQPPGTPTANVTPPIASPTTAGPSGPVTDTATLDQAFRQPAGFQAPASGGGDVVSAASASGDWSWIDSLDRMSVRADATE
jgi:hypothetical protein